MIKNNNIRYILASGSPRRKELLKQAGMEFTVMESHADENIEAGSPKNMVLELSRRKCAAVTEKIKSGEDKTVLDEMCEEGAAVAVIAADTVVAFNDKVLGKPEDENEACRMLMELSGNVHFVFTGVSVSILRRMPDGEYDEENFTFHEETKVWMYPFSEKEAKDYVNTKEPMDKAGAYGIQGKGALLVEKIEGDYNNVVGLPLARLCRELRKRGWSLSLFFGIIRIDGEDIRRG